MSGIPLHCLQATNSVDNSCRAQVDDSWLTDKIWLATGKPWQFVVAGGLGGPSQASLVESKKPCGMGERLPRANSDADAESSNAKAYEEAPPSSVWAMDFFIMIDAVIIVHVQWDLLPQSHGAPCKLTASR